MMEELTGIEALKAVYADGKPEEWEAWGGHSQEWRPHAEWRNWVRLEQNKYRRIRKQRDPKRYSCEAWVRTPGASGTGARFVHETIPYIWAPNTRVRVDVTELIDGASEPETAQPAPSVPYCDLFGMINALEKERDNLKTRAETAEKRNAGMLIIERGLREEITKLHHRLTARECTLADIANAARNYKP